MPFMKSKPGEQPEYQLLKVKEELELFCYSVRGQT